MNLQETRTPLHELIEGVNVPFYLIHPVLLPPIPEDVDRFDFDQIKYLAPIELKQNPISIRHAITSRFWAKGSIATFVVDESPIVKIVNVPSTDTAGVHLGVRNFRRWFEVKNNNAFEVLMAKMFPIKIILAHKRWADDFYGYKNFDFTLILYR